MQNRNFYNIGGILVLVIIVAVLMNQRQETEQKQQAKPKLKQEQSQSETTLLQQIPNLSDEELLRAYYENEIKLEELKEDIDELESDEDIESPGGKLGHGLAVTIAMPGLMRKLKKLRKIRTELLIEMQKRGIELPT